MRSSALPVMLAVARTQVGGLMVHAGAAMVRTGKEVYPLPPLVSVTEATE